MIICKGDLLLNIILCKHEFKAKIGTLGHLAIRIVLDLLVHPLDFSAIFFYLFLLF